MLLSNLTRHAGAAVASVAALIGNPVAVSLPAAKAEPVPPAASVSRGSDVVIVAPDRIRTPGTTIAEAANVDGAPADSADINPPVPPAPPAPSAGAPPVPSADFAVPPVPPMPQGMSADELRKIGDAFAHMPPMGDQQSKALNEFLSQMNEHSPDMDRLAKQMADLARQYSKGQSLPSADLQSLLRPRLTEALPTKSVKLTFKDTDIADALAGLCKAANISYVLPDGLSGKITADLHNVPFEAALAAILSTSRDPLTYDYQGGILNVRRGLSYNVAQLPYGSPFDRAIFVPFADAQRRQSDEQSRRATMPPQNSSAH